MNEGDVGALLRETMTVVLKIGAPPLLAALAVGVAMSLIQVITQINEQTLSVVPKIAVVIGSLVVLGPYMQIALNDFARMIFDRLVAAGAS